MQTTEASQRMLARKKCMISADLKESVCNEARKSERNKSKESRAFPTLFFSLLSIFKSMEDSKTTTPSTEQVATLQVSEQEEELNQIIAESRTHPHNQADDISTGSESSDDEHQDDIPRQELQMVINALQTTVLTTAAVPETAANAVNGQSNSAAAEELHSGDLSSPEESGSEYEYGSQVTPEASVVNEDDLKAKSDELMPPTPGSPPPRHNFGSVALSRRSSDEILDNESFSANLIDLHGIDLKNIKSNNLSPREQEKAGMYACHLSSFGYLNQFNPTDEPVLRAVRHLFNNRFMKAKKLFEREAKRYNMSL